MNLMIGMTSLVTDLGYKMATMFSIGTIQVVSDTLFVFLLGKFLINSKVGLLATLMLELSNFHILNSYWIIPCTLGAILIIPIIFILLKVRRNNPFIGNIVAMLLMGTLVITHPLSSLYLAIILYTFLTGSETYTWLFHEKKNILSITPTINILFSTGMFAYWTYVTDEITFLSYLMKLNFNVDIDSGKYIYLSEIPFLEQIFMSLGMFLFFSLSFIGCFYMISKQFRNINRVSITLCGIVVLCLTFFSLISNMLIILNRWYYFSQILLAIPLSLSLFLLTGIFKHRIIKGVFMFLSVITLSFLLLMSPVANIDNRFFTPNIGVRYALTESEICALNTISIIYDGTIGSDKYVEYFYTFQFNRKFMSIDDSLYSRDFTDLQGVLVLIREEILEYPFQFRQGTYSLSYDPHVILNNQNYSRIYNCGSASGYLKP